MKFKGQHILSTKQFDKNGLLAFFEVVKKMEKVLEDAVIHGKQSKLCEGKILATLFYEPSTRTRFSFETAMLRLGGRVISNFDMLKTSSAVKMETLFDTGKVVSQMADVIAMRHPEVGSVAELARFSDVPVINAGDGSGDHPTQGLLDVYTIWKEKRKLNGLTVGIIGDLKHSRVFHSQCEILKFFNVNFVLISPKALSLPDKFKKEIGKFVEVEDLSKVIDDLDVISVNRIQTERFQSEKEAEKFRGKFVVSSSIMKKAKKDAIILCPLPRREELPMEIDNDPRAKYFEQIKNGVCVRMALFCEIFGVTV